MSKTLLKIDNLHAFFWDKELIHHVAKEVLKITGNSTGRYLEFEAGQLLSLKYLNARNKFSSHPFTINQAPKIGEIQFTIKALGEYG